MASERNKSGTSLTAEHCMLRSRIGNLSTNPFLNFLAVLRPKMRQATASAVVDRGMKLWAAMSNEERQPYYEMARLARRRPGATGTASEARRRRTSRGRSGRRRSKSRKTKSGKKK